MPAPIKVQAPWIGIDLNCDTVLGACAKNALHVDIVSGTAKELPTGHMAYHGGERVSHRPQYAIRLLLTTEFETAVDARDYKVEGSGCDVDVKRILRACAKYGVAVEFNANPWRLDLDWRWHQRALDLGCMMSVNPDAHSTAEIELTHWECKWLEKGAFRTIAC